jgi:hypothetical protein
MGANAFVCCFKVNNFGFVERNVLAAGEQIATLKFAIPNKC